jgi:hypothetical protein
MITNPNPQSVHYIFSSHLGLISCLNLIVRVSTQHHIQTSTEKTFAVGTWINAHVSPHARVPPRAHRDQVTNYEVRDGHPNSPWSSKWSIHATF